MKNEPTFDVYCTDSDKKIATITLNGYHIEAGGTLEHGDIRSFKIVSGELWQQWDQQRILKMYGPQGQSAQVRVAAIPVDEKSAGLLEFI